MDFPYIKNINGMLLADQIIPVKPSESMDISIRRWILEERKKKIENIMKNIMKKNNKKNYKYGFKRLHK